MFRKHWNSQITYLYTLKIMNASATKMSMTRMTNAATKPAFSAVGEWVSS